MIDPRDRFTAAAADYAAARPDYPAALFAWLLSAQPHDAVDLGCGTGIAARQLAARGVVVVGIEPNAAMRESATLTPGFRIAAGEATATGLPDSSADLVIAAQAFHWFTVESALVEIDRILRPGGAACAFWNVRDLDDPLMAAYEALLLTASNDYASVRTGVDTVAQLLPLVDGEERRFPHVHRLDRQGFHQRATSSSYVVHGVADLPAFARTLDVLFDRFATSGEVSFAYQTRALRWERRPAGVSA